MVSMVTAYSAYYYSLNDNYISQFSVKQCTVKDWLWVDSVFSKSGVLLWVCWYVAVVSSSRVGLVCVHLWSLLDPSPSLPFSPSSSLPPSSLLFCSPPSPTLPSLYLPLHLPPPLFFSPLPPPPSTSSHQLRNESLLQQCQCLCVRVWPCLFLDHICLHRCVAATGTVTSRGTCSSGGLTKHWGGGVGWGGLGKGFDQSLHMITTLCNIRTYVEYGPSE